MTMNRLSRWVLALMLLLTVNLFADAPAADPAADKAWADVQAAMRPTPPKEWQTKQPTEAEQKAFAAPAFLKAADLAHDFYTKYPQDKRASQAKFFEMRALNMAERMGATNALPRLEKLEKSQLTDPNASEDERVTVRISEIVRTAQKKGEAGTTAFNTELENGVHEVMKEFPKSGEPYKLLVELARLSEPDKAKQLLAEVANSSVAPEAAKGSAKESLEKMDRVGKPVDIKFKAVDGRDVDVSNMKGKVVLIDFWATWCGPCVAEIPHVKEAYAELHPKGFEIVGISLDKDKSKLTNYVADKKMDWPQYFDGKQWQNEISTRFGIESIPAMWLIDKKGNLRDINARQDLKGKVEKMLAE